MFILKGLSLLILIFIYIIFGLILHFIILIRPHLYDRIISEWTKRFSICLKKILGIKIIIEGQTSYLKEKGNLIIANHLTYLDGVILASLFPGIFVSKLQVKSWPLFGWMSQIGNTIFIDRERKLKSINSLKKITKVLKRKVNIILFPEGTSTDGSKILPFQSIFFQAPLKAGSPIIPITIQYLKINSQNLSSINKDRVFWYGQVEFIKHVFSVLKLKSIEVKVIIKPKIKMEIIGHQSSLRKQLSEICREAILKDFSYITEKL